MEHARYLINEHLHNLRMARPWTAPDAGRCDLWLIQSAMLKAIPAEGMTGEEIKSALKLTDSQLDRGLRALRDAGQIKGYRVSMLTVYRRWHE